MSVSDPDSPSWGEHWTSKKIAETFAPSDETFQAVKAWIASAGITSMRQSHSLGWLHFNATVGEAESLLKTQYHMYEHDTGVTQVICDAYHVPEHVQKHIGEWLVRAVTNDTESALDFITPTIHFDAKVKRGVEAGLSQFSKRENKNSKRMNGPTTPISEVWSFDSIGSLEKKLKVCMDYITPDCLRALYEIPTVSTNNQLHPIGIVEYTPNAFDQADLNLFFKNFSMNQKQVSRAPLLIAMILS